jgi:hypothetical protein
MPTAPGCASPTIWRRASTPSTRPAASSRRRSTPTSRRTASRFDFRWIDLPLFDERGYPRYRRGVTEVPGLYFVGLHWLHTFGSGLFHQVGRDAGYVVNHLCRGTR